MTVYNSATTPTCLWYDDGDEENLGPICGKPATHWSCAITGKPFTMAPTVCVEHKCRCNQAPHQAPQPSVDLMKTLYKSLMERRDMNLRTAAFMGNNDGKARAQAYAYAMAEIVRLTDRSDEELSK